MKAEELYHETNMMAKRNNAMKTSITSKEMKKLVVDKVNKRIDELNQYFEWLDEEKYEDYMHEKYGYGLTATLLIASGETSMDLTFKDI